jgi:hypothetical protein
MEIFFAETAWHVLSAFGVFAIGLLLVATRPFRVVSTKLSVALYLWHSIFCVYYAWFALNNTADARGYFIRSFNSEIPLELGTPAVDLITSFYTQGIGLSYLGTFLVYNVVGAIGLLALAAAFHEVLATKSSRTKLYAMVVLFLPGINFWSGAIGKDAPSLLGTGLLIWAALNLKRRWWAVLVGVLIYVIVRPHIASVILVALALAMLVSGKLSIIKKAMSIAVLAAPSAFAIQLTLSSIGMGESGVFSDAAEFIDYRQSVNIDGGSSVDISGMILPQQMFFFAFMPIFIGPGGLMGLVASFENMLILFLVSASALGMLRRKSSLPSTAKWFFLFFSLAMWIILSMTTVNLGLALRQKWMFMPFLLIFCLSYLPERRIARSQSPLPAPQPPLRSEFSNPTVANCLRNTAVF